MAFNQIITLFFTCCSTVP